ncbi:MAG: hypothetical protein D6809_06215, partial [Gammaproteobacteria bacterium]
AEELARRGARVEEVAVYRRAPPARGLEALAPEARAAVGAVVVTSGEALEQLLAMARRAGLEAWLRSRCLVAISARVAARAREAGFREVLTAPRAADEGLVEALAAWRRGAGGGQALGEAAPEGARPGPEDRGRDG